MTSLNPPLYPFSKARSARRVDLRGVGGGGRDFKVTAAFALSPANRGQGRERKFSEAGNNLRAPRARALQHLPRRLWRPPAAKAQRWPETRSSPNVGNVRPGRAGRGDRTCSHFVTRPSLLREAGVRVPPLSRSTDKLGRVSRPGPAWPS